MKEVQNFSANIFLGLKEGYEGKTNNIEDVYSVCEAYCDMIGLCVTISPTRFIYSDGYEDGCVIGIINYPRFPSTKEEIVEKALELAQILKNKFWQVRVSVVTSDKTYMLE